MRYDLDAIRERIPMVDLYAEAGYQARRAGSSFAGLCPFHDEKTGSFSMRLVSGVWRAKCFGCGWRGDVLDLYAGLRGTDLKTAAAALAGRCGLGPVAEGDGGWKPARAAGPVVSEEWRKPWMAPLEVPTAVDLATLGALRGLGVAGLAAAVARGHLWACEWPWRWNADLKRRVKGEDATRAWVISDGSRWTAQYRRMDGGVYRIGSDEEGWRMSKSWSTKNVSWPVGAPEMGDRWRVLLLEGGADLLATYHFLSLLGMVEEVAVCCVLGASNTLAKKAMGRFKDREVRILPDIDGSNTGLNAAARWQEQLAAAGARVTVGSLEGLQKADGSRVKDVNDLVHCDEATLEEVWPLFTHWGF